MNAPSPATFASQLHHEERPALLSWDLAALPVRICLLQERDVRLLEWQGGEDLRSFYEWQWAQHKAGEREVLVAIFNGFPVGQVALHWSGKVAHPGVPDIQSLRVMPAFRGLHIGTRLIEVCENEVLKRGGARIGLAVGLDNPAVRRLYERLGYVADGQPYMDQWHYIDARGEHIDVQERVIDLIKQLRVKSEN